MSMCAHGQIPENCPWCKVIKLTAKVAKLEEKLKFTFYSEVHKQQEKELIRLREPLKEFKQIAQTSIAHKLDDFLCVEDILKRCNKALKEEEACEFCRMYNSKGLPCPCKKLIKESE